MIADPLRAYWSQAGTRLDDQLMVPVDVGVIEIEGEHMVAISVAGASPVAVTDKTAVDITEMLEWRVDERDMLDDLRRQEQTAPDSRSRGMPAGGTVNDRMKEHTHGAGTRQAGRRQGRRQARRWS